jgi:uncharacterized protein DUF4136
MWKSLVCVAALAALAGCATMNSVDSDVSTYSQWPSGRKPATFAFERLPSQQARPQQQDQLESTARPALLAAGFTEVGDAKAADVTVQVAARINRFDPPIYADPFWGYGGLYYGYGRGYYGRGPYGGPYWGPAWGMSYHDSTPQYQREVAVLIRERESNQVLFEARAANDGYSPGNNLTISAMFEAAMKDFPYSGINPRTVRVPLAKAASSP